MACSRSGSSLIYRSTRVINFADRRDRRRSAAALLGAAGRSTGGADFWLVVRCVALAAGALLGAAVIELTVVRRLFDAPASSCFVATLGVTQLISCWQATAPRHDEPVRLSHPVHESSRWRGSSCAASTSSCSWSYRSSRCGLVWFLAQTRVRPWRSACLPRTPMPRPRRDRVPAGCRPRVDDRRCLRGVDRSARRPVPDRRGHRRRPRLRCRRCCCACSPPRSSAAWSRCRSHCSAASPSASSRRCSSRT